MSISKRNEEPKEMRSNSEIKIKMTPAEKRWALWAIDAMPDYFEELVREGEIERVPPLPKVEGNVLVLPNDSDVLDDFLYRIGEQAPDVCETDATAVQAAARRRTPLKLARKILDQMTKNETNKIKNR